MFVVGKNKNLSYPQRKRVDVMMTNFTMSDVYYSEVVKLALVRTPQDDRTRSASA